MQFLRHNHHYHFYSYRYIYRKCLLKIMFMSYLSAQFHIYYDALIIIILFIQHLRNTYRYCFSSLRVHILGVRNRNRNVNVNVNALIFNTLPTQTPTRIYCLICIGSNTVTFWNVIFMNIYNFYCSSELCSSRVQGQLVYHSIQTSNNNALSRHNVRLSQII